MNKSDYNKTFGIFLKQKRTSKNWSQTDLASKLENNSQNISRIERGELTPTIFWIEKLATAFEIKTSQLISEFEDMREKSNK
ncbi:MAG: helix-turn-helix transcriptional regulator [Bacteroidota bacterium]